MAMLKLFNRGWLLLIAAILGACGDDRASGNSDAGVEYQQVRVLARVGQGIFVGHPGDVITLRALLAVTEVGPIPNGEISWRIAQDPGNTLIQDLKTTTSDSGITENVVTLGDTGPVVVRADSNGAASKAVWKIDVQPVIKHLRIVDSSNVRLLDTSAQAAFVTAPLAGQVQLRVKVTADSVDTEKPLTNEPINFALASSLAGTSFATDSLTYTQGDGQAWVILNSGTSRGTYKVTASTNSSFVEFTVEVKNGGGGTNPGTGTCGTDDRPCPLGYSCDLSTGQCKPAFGSGCDSCPDSTVCDPVTNQCTALDPECDTNIPCPTGFLCQNGICNPNDPNVVDVTGLWFTRHIFDIRSGLPSWVQTLSTGVRVIDQIINGQFNFGLPGWIQAIVGAIIQEVIRSVVPSQVYEIVRILDSIFTIFSNLRAEGEMHLAAVGSPQALSGTEDWTSFIFYMLPLCGGNISGDPAHPPECARMDIMTNQIPQADIALTVKPFAARVSGTTIFMDKREVNMRLAKFLKYVLDEAMKLITGDPAATLENTLVNLIPCPQFAQDMADGLGFPSLEPLFENLCRTSITAATGALVSAVSNTQVTTDVLQFNGQASIRSIYNTNYGDELGSQACERDLETCNPSDGWWKGKFSIGVSVNNVPGRWRASRQPIY